VIAPDAGRGLAALGLLGVVALTSPRATAQQAPADAGAATSRHAAPLSESLWGPARDAYDRATALVGSGDAAGALAKYQEAYETSNDPRLLFDMAICERDLHAYARMQRLLLRFVREAGEALTPEQRADVDAALAEIHALVGTVKLAVSEPGADVSVDDELVGTTPLTAPFTVDTGTHSLRVKKPGFETVAQTIDVPGGNEETVSITFVSLVPSARVVVSTDRGATILLDRKAVALGRFDQRVPSGLHTVDVTQAGKRPYEAQFNLADGDVRTLDVKLVDQPHPLWPWIVGGAAVVVVAGAVVGGYFVFKRDDSGGLNGTLGAAQLPQ
jgi:PEGA domain